MTDDIDKKIEKLANKRKKEISEREKEEKKRYAIEEEEYKKEVVKFKEVYPDFKKIMDKFSQIELENLYDFSLTDKQFSFRYKERGVFTTENVKHAFTTSSANFLYKKTGKKTADEGGMDAMAGVGDFGHGVVTTEINDGETFKSKEKLIDHALTIINDNLTDEEVKKYMK